MPIPNGYVSPRYHNNLDGYWFTLDENNTLVIQYMGQCPAQLSPGHKWVKLSKKYKRCFQTNRRGGCCHPLSNDSMVAIFGSNYLDLFERGVNCFRPKRLRIQIERDVHRRECERLATQLAELDERLLVLADIMDLDSPEILALEVQYDAVKEQLDAVKGLMENTEKRMKSPIKTSIRLS